MYIQKNRLILLACLILASLAAAPFAKNLIPNADSKITLTPSEAMPQFEAQSYYKGTASLSGSGNFLIPVHLPGSKEITDLKIYYTNTTGVYTACFKLYETTPVNGSANLLTTVCDTGATSGIETLTVTDINVTISPSEGLLLLISLSDNQNFYGAKLFYRNP